MKPKELAERAMPPAVYIPAWLMKSRRVIFLIAVSPQVCLLLVVCEKWGQCSYTVLYIYSDPK